MKNATDKIPLYHRAALRISATVAILLATALTILIVLLADRLPVTWEMQVGNMRRVSERTRSILQGTQGSVKVTCFMDRRHPLFRPVARLLKGLGNASRNVAGADIDILYVDPRWDVAASTRLVSDGIPESSIIFEQKHRQVVVTAEEMIVLPTIAEAGSALSMTNRQVIAGVFLGETVCASAIARLSKPAERPLVYWLEGHGEFRCDSYNRLDGYSDIARIMRRNGYELQPLTLAGKSKIPDDARVLLVAGPTHPLAPREQELIGAYLKCGGRLFFLSAPPGAASGLAPLLRQWGIGLTPFTAVSPRTLSGSDVVINTFPDHAVTRHLRNASLVFSHAVCLDLPATSNRADAVETPAAVPLALTDKAGWGELHPDIFPLQFDPHNELRGPVVLAAASEQGASVSRDLAYHSGRVVAVGEAGFVSNSALASRANANRDFFMNALNWLASVETGTAASVGGDAILVTGFSRFEWGLLLVWSTIVLPLLFLLTCFLFRWLFKR